MVKEFAFDLVVLAIIANLGMGLESPTSNNSSFFPELGCPSVIPMGGDSIFGTAPGPQMPSCNMPIRGDAGSVCVDESGAPDYTSIFVDMASVPQKTGCFAWKATDCALDLRRVATISFDIDLRNCDDVWAAPLWISPEPWLNPGFISGEVDFVEFCPTGSVATNFAQPGGYGEQEVVWGAPNHLGGPKHFIMTLHDGDRVGSGGDLTTQICHLDGKNCSNGAYYKGYLDSVLAAKGKNATFPYYFISDVWNGFSGDAGWTGCRAQNRNETSCQFAIRNIRVATNDGSPYFGGGKCTALNAAASPTFV